MNGRPVLDVQRKGAIAQHFIAGSTTAPPFDVGDVVHCTVDWKRRHDHMQQHSGELVEIEVIVFSFDEKCYCSGQHLISALFEREYGVATKSWWLGSEVSYIEIDSTVNLTQDQISRVENMCNELIAASIPVQVHILNDKNEADIPVEVKFCYVAQDFI